MLALDQDRDIPDICHFFYTGSIFKFKIHHQGEDVPGWSNFSPRAPDMIQYSQRFYEDDHAGAW